MEEILEMLSKFGGLVILAALFIWTFYKDKTKNDDLLQRIDKSNENIAKSIDAINKTTEVLKEYICNHDERTKKIEDNIEKLLKMKKER